MLNNINTFCNLFTDYFKREINENYIVSNISRREQASTVVDGKITSQIIFEFTILEVEYHSNGKITPVVREIHTIIECERKVFNIIRNEKIRKLL